MLILTVLGLSLKSRLQGVDIYYSERGGGRIGRVNLDGTGKVTLVSPWTSALCELRPFEQRLGARMVSL
jgi:hypothetical protein